MKGDLIMNLYHVKISKKKLKILIAFIGIFMLFSSCSSSRYSSQYSVTPIDGIYWTRVDKNDPTILIWVDKGYVKGIFFDSISDFTKVKVPAIQFFNYDDVGSMNADYYLNKCNRYLCQTKTVAINKENKDIKYYVVMCGKGRDCWYKR